VHARNIQTLAQRARSGDRRNPRARRPLAGLDRSACTIGSTETDRGNASGRDLGNVETLGATETGRAGNLAILSIFCIINRREIPYDKVQARVHLA
jgi:hypothetical protein